MQKQKQVTKTKASRIAHDWKDTNLVQEYLEKRNPFDYGQELCNVSDGVHAHASVNVDSSEAVGENIISKMVGATAADFSFKRKDQAVTMASKSAVKVGGEVVQVDPQLLFQRLTIAGKSNLEEAMTYELCTFPPALFESKGLLHEPQKATFADALWTAVQNKDVSLPTHANYVVDGGALLHRIPWKVGSTFSNILQAYTGYVLRKYGKAVVVFDGYHTSTTKDMTHRRRIKGKKGPAVSFTREMNLTVAKDLFLNDATNKQRFVENLGQDLEAAGCKVFYASADADVLL